MCFLSFCFAVCQTFDPLLPAGFPTDQRNGDKEFVIRRAATNRVLNVLRHWVSKHSPVNIQFRNTVSNPSPDLLLVFTQLLSSVDIYILTMLHNMLKGYPNLNIAKECFYILMHSPCVFQTYIFQFINAYIQFSS